MMFASCTKNESDLAAVQETVDPTSQKILAFKAKVESGEKSAETMSLDSAVWYVEAALNFTYCMVLPEDNFTNSQIISDSLKIDFSGDNSRVSFADVALAYSNMSEMMTTYSSNLDFSWKKFYSADVKFKNNQLVCYFDIAVKENITNEKVDNFNIYGNLDYDWHCGAGGCLMGRCDGTHMTQSMATVFSTYLTWSKGLPSWGYYTDIQQTDAWDTDVNVNFGSDTLLFRGNYETSPCIVSEEMNYWYNRANILQKRYAPPTGRAVATIKYFVGYNGLPGYVWSELVFNTAIINTYIVQD